MPSRPLPRPFLAAISTALLVALPARADDPRPKVDFDRQVRPILADRCFACHGPDADARKADLRLDLRDEAIQPAESGKPAIVPGEPDKSNLIRKISNRAAKSVMPPPKTGKTVSDAEIATLRDWISQGAEYTSHWSFRPPVAVAPPVIANDSWSRNAIDRFLLAKMEREGLKPSPEADRATLIRRLTLDLTGLPPTLAEIDSFLGDSRPDAYERLVDWLLASPRYGERMALDWLDASRFADTHGYHIDSGRDMSRWRAWVIAAFNDDMPFDRFTVEQVAGDLLPKPTLAQKIASGFNRNHMINFEGGAVPEEYHAAYIIDRVNTTGTVWLGLTIGCAQCHDHKFDPIKQKEYYGFYAFFHNVPENGLDGSKGNAAPLIAAPSAEQQADLDDINGRIADLEARITGPDAKVELAQNDWEKAAKASVRWRPMTGVAASIEGGATFHTDTMPDGAVTFVADGDNPAKEIYELLLLPSDHDITAIRLTVLPDDRYPNHGPGRSDNGNIVLTDVRIAITETPRSPSATPVRIREASADFSQTDFPVALAIDGKPETGWAIFPEMGKPHEATFVPVEPIRRDTLPNRARIRVTLSFHSPFAGHHPGKFRVDTTAAENPLGAATLPAIVREALAIETDKRSDAQKAAIREHYRRTVCPEFRPLIAELETQKKRRAEVEKSIPTAMVMSEMDKPRNTFVLMRGQYDKKGEKVTAGVPAFLPSLPDDAPKNRLGLARWLVDPKHPLTSRVAVNRLWQGVFGTGLVKTSEDFGTQGEAPSHPELLDWLAVEFTAPKDGPAWSVKRMIRLMVTSAAYRQSSNVTPDKLARDPEDRFLSRAPRLRLSAEALRDQALFVGGLLKERVGGPSVSPYNPPGLWEELMSRADGKNWSAQTYTQSHGDDLYRRTMYTFWKRTCPPPSLATFDAPDRETCTVRRARTNTPLQALVMLNDPTYVEASRKLAERIIKEGGDTDDRHITFAFRLATSRQPRAEEVAILRTILVAERAKFRAEPEKAKTLLGIGEAKRDETLDSSEVAAWSAVAGVILNLDEVVTRG